MKVIYLHRTHDTRGWTVPTLLHEGMCLDEQGNDLESAQADVLTADLAVFNYYAERPARQLLKKRAVSGRPWCFWGERPGFQKPEWIGRMARRCFLSWLHHSQAPIWGIGRYAVERYQAEFGLRRTYRNLPYFSDLERFRSATGRHERKLSERVFLFSGSLSSRKGADLLGNAFLRLASEFSNVRLRLLGDGELRKELEQTLHPVQECVEFFGFKDWHELPFYYAAAHVLCVPSRYDGWGLVVPEGLACGLPVIGTDRMGSAIEFIENGRNGWLLPAGDEDSLLSALREAALLPDSKLAEMSAQAQQSVREHSLEHGTERFIRAADEAVTNWHS